ncbi:DUF3817 domain-containing protein [Acinetobacter sp. Ac_5812]|uniref:DUF3817 domain-containing protein n=1 Tax=Acinetobacter sp. Ac_5812 TaxID=1848937 RepID=UPI00148F54B5|nr:DUF3817 domain-containing protein [Acinetobacter sp. Ac_5812]NNP69968.1 hypothetical protein [Acinetobacter sp. Ac_5812]
MSAMTKKLQQMRFASVLEAVTLLLLFLVAIPLKYTFDLPIATKIMGPVHGLAFLFYLWNLVRTASVWSGIELLRLFILAFIPLGGFFNEKYIAHRQASLK